MKIITYPNIIILAFINYISRNKAVRYIIKETPLKILISIRAIIYDSNEKILLVRRAKDTTWNPGVFELPGGKPKFGENLNECIANEIFEETGLSINIQGESRIIGSHIENTNIKYKDFLVLEATTICDLIGSNHVILSNEHSEYMWKDKFEIMRLSNITKQTRTSIASFFKMI